jgi:hypothetical protein
MILCLPQRNNNKLILHLIITVLTNLVLKTEIDQDFFAINLFHENFKCIVLFYFLPHDIPTQVV